MTRVFTPWRRTAAVTALVLLLVILVGWSARTFVFARLAELYLMTRGVPAAIEISRLNWSGLDASLRLGARRTPDLAVEHMHAVFNGDWIPKVQSLTLTHSVMRVAFDGEKLSFGTLQPLADSLSVPPPQSAPAAASTSQALRIVLKDAKVLAFTPAGVLSFAANGSLRGGNVERLSGAIGRANLRAPDFALMLSGGNFSAHSRATGLDLHIRVLGHGFSLSHVRASEASIRLDVAGFDWRDVMGFASAHAELAMQSVRGRALAVSRAEARIDLGAWQADGAKWSGPADAVFAIANGRVRSFSADKLSVRAQSPNLTFDNNAFSGALDANIAVSGGQYRTKTAALALPSFVSHAKGELQAGTQITASLNLSAAADLAMASTDARRFARAIPLLGDDPRNVRATAAALHSAKLDAPAIYIGKSAGLLVVTLPAPVTLTAKNGARARLAQAGNMLLSVDAGNRMTGGFAASVFGGGLPRIALRVPQFAAREKTDGLVLLSSLDLSARASYGSLRGIALQTNGRLAAGQGRYDFVPNGCAKLGLHAYVSHDKPSLSDLRTNLCPLPQQPLLTSGRSGWRIRGMWRNLTAELDAAAAHATSKSGHIDIAGGSNGMESGFVETVNAQVTDAKSAARFAPLLASGRLNLADDLWRGTIGIAIANTGRNIAAVTVRHDMQTQSGEAAIVSDLAFTPDGFQPVELSPLMASLTRATATARFRGRIAWTANGQTSGGMLTVDDADFNGPLGVVRHAHTKLAFTSLSPLATAPAQEFAAGKIEWLVPFSDLVLRFQLAAETLRIESFDAQAAGGRVALAPMAIALDPNATASGTLKLDRVNLGALVTASNLADKISLNAPVSGAIPFRFGPKGLRVTDGHLASVGPSRLSIRRTVWTGAKQQAQTDAITDFAYQALENLAIDALDAKLNSLPGGRLGVLFHIKGRNDPAVAEETRLSVFDLLQGHAFDKPLPLPKGTPVDLTLDTSLNFDELLDAYRNAFSASLAEAAATSERNEGTSP
jgi:hypothetical protein